VRDHQLADRTVEIPERSGNAFRLAKGQVLTVIDPRGCQVADLLAFRADDLGEVLSSGRTLDYANRQCPLDPAPDR